MIRDFLVNDFNNDLIEKSLQWCYNNASIKKVLNGEKYFVIDWRNVDVNEVKNSLSKIDKELISEYINQSKQLINNVEVLFAMYQYIETENEEYMWNKLVDELQIISHEMYCKNTYRENFDILLKFTNFILPLN